MPVIVTSMNKAYWEMTNGAWLQTLLKHNPTISYYIVSEDLPECIKRHNFRTVGINRLDSRLGHDDFIKLAEFHIRNVDTTNYRYQPVRFSFKPYTLLQASKLYQYDDIYWFDADVEFTDAINFDHIKPDPYGVSYLGRDSWPHSEAGFIGIGTFAKDFIQNWVSYYTTGALFTLDEWHDVMAMDRCLVETSGLRLKNLSEHVHDKHPWPYTALAEFSVHYKGPGRKMDKFNSNEALHGVVYADPTWKLTDSKPNNSEYRDSETYNTYGDDE